VSREIILETKLVGDVKGEFYIPSYQRGYRWGVDEVNRLLDDIYTNGDKNYCLQPVVVRRRGNQFELIDGQQRLTTIYILLQYIKKEFKERIPIEYSLTYETRKKSTEFLSNINKEEAEENIDFFHVYQAYKTIDEWFKRQKNIVVAADDIYGYLVKYVKIIWYKIDDSEDAISLFTRLNIGKIPLTVAELVKAMFLSRDNEEEIDRKKQEEISLQWDNIEREFHNDRFWYFLTNQTNVRYQTKIDLVLNLISKKPEKTYDKYYTFFKFDNMRKEKSLDTIWQDIQRTFLILKDWYEDHELYHKIGYLITSKSLNLQQIYDLSKDKTKDEFIMILDVEIKKSINVPENYGELSYEKKSDAEKISTLLLLFNIESVRQNGEQSQWFPFEKFKFNKEGKINWSLEHIHAQHSEGMRTQDSWQKWLKLHIPSVRALDDNNNKLIEDMENAISKSKLVRSDFETLQQKIVDVLSERSNIEYLHSIANLALLNSSDNAALSNSTFDVKRNVIVEMDKKGQYIPFCTKMVFLKYYTPSEENQLHFWGQADRLAYVKAINEVLKDYLNEPISVEQGGS